MYAIRYKQTGRLVARAGITLPATFNLDFAEQFEKQKDAEAAVTSDLCEVVRVSGKLEKMLERDSARATLLEILKPGDTVTGLVRSVSSSGMSRQIDFYCNDPRGGLRYLSGYIATALDYRRAQSGALIVGGCGMDMIFAVVYDLGRVLFRDAHICTGVSTGEGRCTSNDHNNGVPYKAGTRHADSGYALRSGSL